MTVAILQSSYIPWRGYFDIINSVDLFVFYDDVQYTSRDWRNRNKIKTQYGPKWLTIPCGNNRGKRICDVELTNRDWQKQHWNLISVNYSEALHFSKYKEFLETVYLKNKWTNLSEFNQFVIRNICDLLGIVTKFEDSLKFELTSKKEDRLLELLRCVGASEYLSGPSAKAYLSESNFEKEGIKVKWMDYSKMQEYNQLYPPFVHEVSILDLLFNEGPNAHLFMKSFSDEG